MLSTNNSPESFTHEKKYVERIKNTEKISSGRFIIFVGNQIGRVMNREERKYGKLRAFMPTLPQDYYYSIPFTEKGEYGRQKLSKKMKTQSTLMNIQNFKCSKKMYFVSHQKAQ